MRFLPALGVLASALLITACASTSAYEGADLLTLTHNANNEYTLLVYRDMQGATRQVLRRKGVFEMAITEADGGKYILKERGRQERKITAPAYEQIEERITVLLHAQGETPPLTSGIVPGQDIE